MTPRSKKDGEAFSRRVRLRVKFGNGDFSNTFQVTRAASFATRRFMEREGLYAEPSSIKGSRL